LGQRRLRKRGESVDKKEREKEKEQIRYILQLSTDHVTVTLTVLPD